MSANDTEPAVVFLGLADATAPSRAARIELAEALSASAPWGAFRDAHLVVGSGPVPPLAVVGSLDDTQRGSLQALATQLDHALTSRVLLGYPEVESACADLAASLTEQLGPEALSAARWFGVPRGGLIVLGLLAYALGLEIDPHRDDTGGTVVVVDDVAVSGSRFRRLLPTLDAERIVFAHLYSTPQLRAALADLDARVEPVAAIDLVDHAPERLGADHAAWTRAWKERDPDAVWCGQPQHVAFPWSEPDISVWNEQAGRVEAGWRTVPPSRCIKHRATDTGARPVVVPASTRLHDDVIALTRPDEVVVARRNWERPLVLQGSAADFWAAILDHESRADAVQALTSVFDVDEERLAADVADFSHDLVQRGVLRGDQAP